MPNIARKNVCVTLPASILEVIDSLSNSRQLPRSYVVQDILERAIADSQRPPDRPHEKHADARRS